MANSTRTEQPTGRKHARPAAASRRVLLQAAAPRPGDPDRPPDPRAARPVHGAGHLLVGRALLRRLRHRGDAADAVHRRRGGDGRVRADHAALARDRRRAGDPDVQLPPDDQGLPVRGRRVHRHEGQLRVGAGAGRGGRAADGLRPHRGGLGVGGRLRHHRRRPVAARVPRADVSVLHRADRHRQPARRQGVGTDLRGADVPVPHDDRIAGPARDREALDRERCITRRPRVTRRDGTSNTPPRGSSRSPSSGSSSDCTRSRPGARP